MLPSSFPAPLSPSCVAPKAPPSRESQDKRFHTYKNDLTGRFSGRYLKICGTAQLNYKICPKSPSENTATSKRIMEGFGCPPMLTYNQQWVRKEEESRSISNPQKPLFSWLGTPNASDTAY